LLATPALDPLPIVLYFLGYDPINSVFRAMHLIRGGLTVNLFFRCINVMVLLAEAVAVSQDTWSDSVANNSSLISVQQNVITVPLIAGRATLVGQVTVSLDNALLHVE
jgi:hypothetical protein